MTYAESAISDGLTPRKMEFMLRNGCPLDEIAMTYYVDVLTVRLLMKRWGLDHLSGREKSDVTLVRSAKGMRNG